ncbi:hypothetical protein NDU88_004688 [Pleurodeles waltl]|uniref:Uncharacterized protein n=1 Tax=Pleurodeles waltl TaxID=8319 RepID=A0AAV7TUC1_PLEWA|nr:hypothetical protein NDU88_004688 [Pleurodeles waltl]
MIRSIIIDNSVKGIIPITVRIPEGECRGRASEELLKNQERPEARGDARKADEQRKQRARAKPPEASQRGTSSAPQPLEERNSSKDEAKCLWESSVRNGT